jgi:hypothetical protein
MGLSAGKADRIFLYNASIVVLIVAAVISFSRDMRILYSVDTGRATLYPSETKNGIDARGGDR